MMLTKEIVRGFFEYDERNSDLIWKVNKRSRVRKGDVAGTLNKRGSTKNCPFFRL